MGERCCFGVCMTGPGLVQSNRMFMGAEKSGAEKSGAEKSGAEKPAAGPIQSGAGKAKVVPSGGAKASAARAEP